MNTEVIITCAVTGAGDTAGKHPELPVTPPQIAAACLEAAKAGAAITHIHVRDPKTAKGSRDPVLFREVVEIVRKKNTDLILNLTAGMGGDYVPSAENPAVGGPGTDLVGPSTGTVVSVAVTVAVSSTSAQVRCSTASSIRLMSSASWCSGGFDTSPAFVI